MANNAPSYDLVQIIEELIAEILAGREALIELDAVILANRQFGNLSEEEAQMLFDATDKARRGIQNGLRLGRMVRSPPPDLEALSTLLETWNRERRNHRGQT